MHLKGGDGIALMVQRHDVLIIREEINGLRVIPANRQNTDFLQ